MQKKYPLVLSLLLIVFMISTAAVPFGSNGSGFKTTQPAMLTAVMPGVQVTPLLTVGDVLPSGFRFEAVPDGISVRTRGQGRVDLFVNHETSKSPFPYNPLLSGLDFGESQNDFDNAQVSRLILNQHSAGVLNGSFVIDSSSGYQRFCSNYLATSKEGFDRDILFTNEESPDYFLRQEASWPPASLTDPNQREAGLVVALDVQTGQHHPIYGMGRHNHENSVPIPGYGYPVVFSGDDTFTSGPLADPFDLTSPFTNIIPSQSELYSYMAADTDALLADEGDLWAFVAAPGYTDYYDFPVSSGITVTGQFIKVPKNIATGLNPDGSEMKAGDVPASEGGPFPLPPFNGSWQTDLRNTTPTGIDGPQWVLEYWSYTHNVFQFVRVEDIAYDKRPGQGNVVYIVDSGRGRASGTDTPFLSKNGRVWKMVLDPTDPTNVLSFGIFVEGDDNPVKTLTEIHQPDNIETTATGLLLVEDPGSSQQFTPAQQVSDSARATTSRLWFVPFSGTGAGTPIVVAKVNQSADEGVTDVDPADNPPFAGAAFPISPGNWGAWEATGIVDASEAFGPGYFFINVQAHTLWVDSAVGPDNTSNAGVNGIPDGDSDFMYKREGGQLLLVHIPATIP